MSIFNLPDGPKTHPLIQTFQWLTKPLEYMEECNQRYGDIFSLQLGQFPPQVIISNPQAIEQIFTTDPKQLDSGSAAGVMFPLLGQQSLFALDGKPHQRQRKLLAPSFHGKRMLAYGQLIREITEQVTSQWQLGEPFTVLPFMQEISLQVILKAIFGLEDGSRYEKLKELLIAILNPKVPILKTIVLFFPALRQDLGAWSPWGKFLRLRSSIDELIYAQIRERQEKPDPSRTDILSLMMAARDEAGEPMTQLELRDELMTLLAAGHETTATTLSWALYWIHHQPQVREKLLQELNNIGEHPNAILRRQSPPEALPYLNAVCSETLRIYPVGLSAIRLVKSPLEIGGYTFEPGTLLNSSIYLTHHREDLYPQPKQFKPERFLERQFTPYEYIPFGGGSRGCIGMAFALFEMKLVLTTILSRWQMELADNKPVQPVLKGLSLIPASGVRMVVKGKRSHASAHPPDLEHLE